MTELASTCPLSVVIPVYGNQESLPELIRQLEVVLEPIPDAEVVFVVDASPDDSERVLRDLLPAARFASQLVTHARNFGSFPAIRTGLTHARGAYISVIAADLQEPTDLVIRFRDAMVESGSEIAVGVRRSRADRKRDRWTSEVFWLTYRRVVQPDIPKGGVDVFACSANVRDRLLALDESSSSLVGLLFWIGFPRVEVEYDRVARQHGTSGWSFRAKVRYLMDSVFAFTDLPIRIVMALGAIGVATSLIVGAIVVIARLSGLIDVPGYAAIMLLMSFFAGLNLCAIGIVGSYISRTYENTKRRPLAIEYRSAQYRGSVSADVVPNDAPSSIL